MENSYPGSSFMYPNETRTSDDISISSQRNNILRDNYSLEEILELYVQEVMKLLDEFKDMSSNENNKTTNETCLDFTLFMRQRNIHIENLAAELEDLLPSAYPKFRAEAFEQLKTKLTNEVEEFQEMNRHGIAEKQNVKTENESITRNIKVLERLLENTETVEDSEALKAIEHKLISEKFEEAKKNLDYTLKKIYPNHEDQLRAILTKLIEKSQEDDEENQWISVENEMDYALVATLLRANIVKKKTDMKQIRLLKCFN